MCDINAFVREGDVETPILENVDVVTTEGDQVRLLNIFGEERTLAGRMVYYNNSEKKMVFTAPYAAESRPRGG
jgi:predicted RNA-binding protein